jgi:hypothetical protein
MELCAFLQVLIGVLYHADQVLHLFFNLVNALDIIKPLVHVLGLLDLEFVIVEQAFAIEVLEDHHNC